MFYLQNFPSYKGLSGENEMLVKERTLGVSFLLSPVGTLQKALGVALRWLKGVP